MGHIVRLQAGFTRLTIRLGATPPPRPPPAPHAAAAGGAPARRCGGALGRTPPWRSHTLRGWRMAGDGSSTAGAGPGRRMGARLNDERVGLLVYARPHAFVPALNHPVPYMPTLGLPSVITNTPANQPPPPTSPPARPG